MSSEGRHGVSEQPTDTCPLLDDVITNIEYIRNHVISIRAWGEEWKQLAIEYDKAKLDAEDKVSELEGEISDRDREIGDLKNDLEQLKISIIK